MMNEFLLGCGAGEGSPRPRAPRTLSCLRTLAREPSHLARIPRDAQPCQNNKTK